MSRRSNAQAIDTRTITATTFCIALIAAQIAPPSGAERIVSMIPPVTTFAVPIVKRTKPQKIPACISPARGSLNILRWTRAYSTRPAKRAPIAPKGRGCSTAGRVAANTRRCRAMARANTMAAPQNTTKTTGYAGTSAKTGNITRARRARQRRADRPGPDPLGPAGAAKAVSPSRPPARARLPPPRTTTRGRRGRPASRARGREPE